jgi:hypothetical protein
VRDLRSVLYALVSARTTEVVEVASCWEAVSAALRERLEDGAEEASLPSVVAIDLGFAEN